MNFWHWRYLHSTESSLCPIPHEAFCAQIRYELSGWDLGLSNGAVSKLSGELLTWIASTFLPNTETITFYMIHPLSHSRLFPTNCSHISYARWAEQREDHKKLVMLLLLLWDFFPHFSGKNTQNISMTRHKDDERNNVISHSIKECAECVLRRYLIFSSSRSRSSRMGKWLVRVEMWFRWEKVERRCF